MTAINLERANGPTKFDQIDDKLKPKLLPNKKIYYSERYIYLDKSEFCIVWYNVGLFIFLHVMWFRGLWGVLTLDPEFIKCAPVTILFSIMSGFGVTCGAHRLWSHRSYKAKLPLRIFLIIGHLIAGQNNLIAWCRDHRVHHKFSDTDADPHNTNPGFFFAHFGWLMFKKHPDVPVKGSKIDLSDLKQDPLIRFQAKYYYSLYFLVNLVIPIYISVHYFGSTFYYAFLYSYMLRYASALHSTWFVNSAAHMFGDKPYNEKIRAVENIYVSFFSIGEGYHNYHHTFPYDYATSEFSKFNVAKVFIEFMVKYGLAYNLKRASENSVSVSKAKVQKQIFKMNKEDENSNYTLIYKNKENSQSIVHLDSQTNGSKMYENLDEEKEPLGGQQLKEVIKEMNRKDFNNNILRNIEENGKLKGR